MERVEQVSRRATKIDLSLKIISKIIGLSAAASMSACADKHGGAGSNGQILKS